MKVSVNHDVCIGCGLCASLNEDLFEMNDEGLAQATAAAQEEGNADSANECADSCPVSAIEVE